MRLTNELLAEFEKKVLDWGKANGVDFFSLVVGNFKVKAGVFSNQEEVNAFLRKLLDETGLSSIALQWTILYHRDHEYLDRYMEPNYFFPNPPQQPEI